MQISRRTSTDALPPAGSQPASGLKPPAYGLASIRVGDQPPAPPTGATATSTSYGTATIAWQPPTDTGGGPITGYTITSSPDGQTQIVAGTATSGIMIGLTPGATYTFTITAASDGGTSLPSAPTGPAVIDDVTGVVLQILHPEPVRQRACHGV